MSNDNWKTPPEVIDFIQNKFGTIKIDLCSSDENKVCENNLDEDCNFLDESWIAYAPEEFNVVSGELAWCNPPYSNPLPFVKQCIKWAKHGYAIAGILNLDSSTKWFKELIAAKALIMPIVGGRISFLDENGKPSKGNNKPQFMFYLAPFLAIKTDTIYVSIKEIY